MKLESIDWAIIIAFFAVSLIIGLITSKSAGKSSEDFFLSGRSMPWWLLGVSMVATTFAADTPGLVTELVREDGVSGNWVWWAQLFTGVLTVVFYAKLWRKSGVTTDLEFYELRYSGKSAAFLRGFRAIYLGVIFNVITMAGVCLAGSKIVNLIFGMDQAVFLLIAGSVTVVYSVLGGLKGVLLTDFFQFIIAMIGSIWATYYIVNMPEIGGMTNMMSQLSSETLSIFPDFTNSEAIVTLLVIPLAVQWWSTWYPGAEPGGGGYIAQRMLAAKDEKNATFATLFFNIAHYALRPWPWILIALASMIVFPTLESIEVRFPDADASLIKADAAYSAMLTFLPKGLIGIVLASLIAAFMSTISTQLNWGSSYVVNDFYDRFINPKSTEKQKVNVGRISTVVLMIIAGCLSMFYESAKGVFDLIILIGAGTGLLFIVRWFWRRVNPWSEITAMAVSFIIATVFFIYNGSVDKSDELSSTFMLLFSVGFTTVCWVAVTLVTKPEKDEVIAKFENKVFGSGVDLGQDESILDEAQRTSINKFQNFGMKILGFFLTILAIYNILFATGYFLYGQTNLAFICVSISLVSTVTLIYKRREIFY
ncbi:MAG: SSS family solute:Na+ symporter [Flavobacteriales bacterium]|jgi:SSS family solute:Na+ symporter